VLNSESLLPSFGVDAQKLVSAARQSYDESGIGYDAHVLDRKRDELIHKYVRFILG
jgi:hypothetical protein